MESTETDSKNNDNETSKCGKCWVWAGLTCLINGMCLWLCYESLTETCGCICKKDSPNAQVHLPGAVATVPNFLSLCFSNRNDRLAHRLTLFSNSATYY